MIEEPRPDPQPATVESRLLDAWREFRRCASMQSLRREIYGTEADALEIGQYDALDRLVDSGGMRMNALAEALRIDASTATRAVARLVEAGLAERVRDDGDARGVVVVPTGQGRHRHAEVRLRAVELVSRVLDGFRPEERETLARLLDRYVQALDRLLAT